MRGLFALAVIALLTATGCAPPHQTTTVQLIEPALVLKVPTDDGAEIALHHYPPKVAAVSSIPVLICHGIASNTRTWALGPGRDVGEYLSGQGFDVYLVDLRGHGASGPARSDASADTTSMDTYALHDVPAAVNAARAASGADEAVWIGHSMGGLVMVAYLQRVEDHHLAAAATVASPVDWRGADHLTRVIHRLLSLLSGPGPLPARDLAAFYAQWEGDIPLHLDRVVYEPTNMARPYLADMMRVGLSPIQAGVRRQFAATIAARRFVSLDGAHDYLEGASSITVPFLVVSGRTDHLCPPERTVTFFDRLASTDKTWRVFGLDQGDHADYGHVDLCNGDHAADDVYPYLADWLRARIAGR